MKTIAIIPARGGSKRIERKNVKPFAGLPVIAYSIKAALAAGCFDTVMVSTDDPEIAATAESFGAEVPFLRSAATSDDFATTADVLREVIDEYGRRGVRFDALACIYATAPFVTPERLREAWEMLEAGKCGAAFTCVEYSYPIQRSLKIDADGMIRMNCPEFRNARSQDLAKTYHDAGQFYLSTIDSFLRSGSLWGEKTMPVILPETEVQDLDTPTDWRLAEIKYALLMPPREIRVGDYRLVAYPWLDAETSELMRRGRNFEEIRRQMVNRDEIAREGHEKFRERLLFSRDRQYYAVYRQDEAKPIGSVTLESLGDGAVERGVWLFPENQGKGHAGRMLRALYAWLAAERGVHEVMTRVRRCNEASLALERSLGAELRSSDPDYHYFSTRL